MTFLPFPDLNHPFHLLEKQFYAVKSNNHGTNEGDSKSVAQKAWGFESLYPHQFQANFILLLQTVSPVALVFYHRSES
ncbi:hypothetical protein ACYCVF_35505 [Bradyrhizobium sp. 1.29L]